MLFANDKQFMINPSEEHSWAQDEFMDGIGSRRPGPYIKRDLREVKLRTPSQLVHEQKLVKRDSTHKKSWNQDHPIAKAKSEIRREIASDIIKKQKRLASHGLNPEQNMFKNGSMNTLVRKGRKDFKLPLLEKKGIFDQIYPHNQQMHVGQSQILDEDRSRPKVIKVPIDRLRPLRAEDLRRKFESKFKINMENSHAHLEEVGAL